MAIARATASDFTTTFVFNGGTTATKAFDSGSGETDRYLVVSIATAFSTDIITGITYNGTSLTLLHSGYCNEQGTYEYIHGLAAPSTGSNDIVVTKSGANSTFALNISAVIYSGVKQTGQPDATGSGTKTGGGTLSLSLTTVADNAWLVGVHGDGVGSATAGADTNLLDDYFGTGSGTKIWDSTSTRTPAGSQSLAIALSGAADGRGYVASLAPTPAVGPANLKTLNGIAKAGIKQINGIAIASIKSYDGIV